MAIIISRDGKGAKKVDKTDFKKENSLQEYIHANPEVIPLYDIKEDIRLLILAREFPTTSGPIDAIGVDKDGEIYVVETKLYKNPDKRTVVAQVLDYGAALWKSYGDSDDFFSILESRVQVTFKMSLGQKLKEYFGFSEDELAQHADTLRRNLNDGALRFVVLMDKLDDRLKDLILYVNQNSQFDIYAVELEYYKHESFEIIIPRIYGAEVKKDAKIKQADRTLWNWDLFKRRMEEFGKDEVEASRLIIEWAEKNGLAIEWTTSKRGGFFLCYYPDGKKGFYPFSVTGDAMIRWNAPHHGGKCPVPFNDAKMRRGILERLSAINGAIVDLNNVDGFNGFKMPLRLLADPKRRNKFFEVCTWISESFAQKTRRS